jgi:molecular chaperone GrpE (heat shock protein)
MWMDEESAAVSIDTVVENEPSPSPGDEIEATSPSSPLQDLTDGIAALATEVREAAFLAKHREQTISRLHDEVQELRKGELAQALAPLFRDLIRLHDDLAGVVAEKEAAGDADAAKTFAYFRGEILEMLARNNVEPFDLQSGDRFDPSQSRAIGVVPSNDPVLDRCIATMQRRGFRLGPRVLRVAEVEVYRTATAAPPRLESSEPIAVGSEKGDQS